MAIAPAGHALQGVLPVAIVSCCSVVMFVVWQNLRFFWNAQFSLLFQGCWHDRPLALTEEQSLPKAVIDCSRIGHVSCQMDLGRKNRLVSDE